MAVLSLCRSDLSIRVQIFSAREPTVSAPSGVQVVRKPRWKWCIPVNDVGGEGGGDDGGEVEGSGRKTVHYLFATLAAPAPRTHSPGAEAARTRLPDEGSQACSCISSRVLRRTLPVSAARYEAHKLVRGARGGGVNHSPMLDVVKGR